MTGFFIEICFNDEVRVCGEPRDDEPHDGDEPPSCDVLDDGQDDAGPSRHRSWLGALQRIKGFFS